MLKVQLIDVNYMILEQINGLNYLQCKILNAQIHSVSKETGFML